MKVSFFLLLTFIKRKEERTLKATRSCRKVEKEAKKMSQHPPPLQKYKDVVAGFSWLVSRQSIREGHQVTWDPSTAEVLESLHRRTEAVGLPPSALSMSGGGHSNTPKTLKTSRSPEIRFWDTRKSLEGISPETRRCMFQHNKITLWRGRTMFKRVCSWKRHCIVVRSSSEDGGGGVISADARCCACEQL